MLGKIIGAVAGAKAADHVRGISGPGGATELRPADKRSPSRAIVAGSGPATSRISASRLC